MPVIWEEGIELFFPLTLSPLVRVLQTTVIPCAYIQLYVDMWLTCSYKHLMDGDALALSQKMSAMVQAVPNPPVRGPFVLEVGRHTHPMRKSV